MLPVRIHLQRVGKAKAESFSETGDKRRALALIVLMGTEGALPVKAATALRSASRSSPVQPSSMTMTGREKARRRSNTAPKALPWR